MTDWKGAWRNQYGSILTITDDAGGVIRGSFKTALTDSSFYGQEIPVLGMASGDTIALGAAGEGKHGPAAVTYAGILQGGKLETLWHTVASATLSAVHEGDPARLTSISPWRAFGTSLDTFERVAG